MVFVHSPTSTHTVSVRGKSVGAYPDCATFQWTKAVRALALLFLTGSLKGSQESTGVFKLNRLLLTSGPLLEGGEGSAASSLDYAIEKETSWLLDFFGRDRHGAPLVRKLFRTTNSDRRHQGPVGIALSPAFWDQFRIAILVDGIAAERSSVEALQLRLQGFWTTTQPIAEDTLLLPETPNSLTPFLTNLLCDEFKLLLHQPNIFAPSAVRSSLSAIASAGYFRSVAGKDLELGGRMHTSGLAQHQFGILTDSRAARTCFDETLSIATPSTFLGPLMLFFHLKRERGYAFDFNYVHPHAVSLVQSLIDGSFGSLPDIVCAGLAPAATLVGSPLGAEYVPLLLLADQSQAIVAPKSLLATKGGAERALRDPYNRAEYGFIKESPSVPSFVFDELVSLGITRPAKVNTVHQEPHESFQYLAQGNPDSRAVLFFPHYALNCAFNNCTIIKDPRQRKNSQEVVIFAHRRKLTDPRFAELFETVIRDAWFDFCVRPELIRQTVEHMTRPDELYFKCVTRYSGLFTKHWARV